MEIDTQSRSSKSEKDMEIIVVETCLLAGKIMLQSGAETYRVEDTMTRIAQAGRIHGESFVMPTGIIFSSDDAQLTKLNRISNRSTDLDKVIQVNQISRLLCQETITMNEAYKQLQAIHDAPASYSLWFQIFSAVLTSCGFLFMFGGTWQDMIPAGIAGGIGYWVVTLVHHWSKLKFFAEFAASLMVGFLSILFITEGVGHAMSIIIIAAVMPMVPGILITNAVRDLIAGHLVSGLSKGAEATLTAFAIGAGIAVALQIL